MGFLLEQRLFLCIGKKGVNKMPIELYIIFMFVGVHLVAGLLAVISNCFLTHRMKTLYLDVWNKVYDEYKVFLPFANTRKYFEFLNNILCCEDKKIFLLKRLVRRAFYCSMACGTIAFLLAFFLCVRLVYFS